MLLRAATHSCMQKAAAAVLLLKAHAGLNTAWVTCQVQLEEQCLVKQSSKPNRKLGILKSSSCLQLQILHMRVTTYNGHCQRQPQHRPTYKSNTALDAARNHVTNHAGCAVDYQRGMKNLKP